MNKRGFTLVELLAVIVILGIILAIAIPGISGLIEKARRNAFEDSVKLIIKSIDTKVTTDNNYDVEDLSVDTMGNDLGIGNNEYEFLGATVDGNDVYIDVVGQDKFNGLEAHGTLNDLIVGKGGGIVYTLAPESCFTFDDGTGTITDYDLDNASCPKSLKIPNTIHGIYVEHIGPGAFIDPISQTCYTYNGFRGENGNLKTVNYVHTDSDSYDYCSYDVDLDNIIPITGVQLPFRLETIGYDAFKYNQISNLIIPNSVTLIDHGAFSYNQISSLTLGSGVTTINYKAFAVNLLSSLNVPASVTHLSGFNDNQLTSVTLHSGITTLGRYAFFDNQLTNITLPSSLTTIGGSAFDFNYLSSITIPNGVTTIDDGAFYYNRLTEVNIPSGVTTIGHSAFRSNGITNLTIPSSVTYIGGAAFNDNKLPDAQALIYARNGDGSENTSILVSYAGAKDDNVVIPNNVITVSGYALVECGINSVTIPNTVTSIGDYAFGSNNLTSVNIPNTVTTIGEYAFTYNLLTSVTIPSSITRLNHYSFSFNRLSNITLPSSITRIDDGAFRGNLLTSVTIPSDVTNMYYMAFLKDSSSNPGLTNIVNKTGRSFNWGEIVNGPSGFNFVTGTVVNSNGNVTVTSN